MANVPGDFVWIPVITSRSPVWKTSPARKSWKSSEATSAATFSSCPWRSGKTVGANTVGGISQRNEICSQSVEDRDSRTHSRGLRPCRFQGSSGRRPGHSHGIAQQEEVFVSGNSGNELRRATFDPHPADEDLSKRA